MSDILETIRNADVGPGCLTAKLLLVDAMNEIVRLRAENAGLRNKQEFFLPEIERLRAENADMHRRLSRHQWFVDRAEETAADAARSMRERAKPAIKAALKAWEDDPFSEDDRERDAVIEETLDAMPLIEEPKP